MTVLELAGLLIGGFCGAVWAEVRLPSGLFTSNAVFQRDVPIHLWGWANPGEKASASFGKERATTKARKDGTFDLYLPPQKATYYGKTLTVWGEENRLVFHNIVVGEVWVCSGQSNMELPLACRPSGTGVEMEGDYSYIRINRPAYVVAPEPLADVKSPGWKICACGVQKEYTAVGFHFAERIHRELDVPVGIIDSNWDGADITWWTPEFIWKDFPQLAQFGEDAKKSREIFANQDTRLWRPKGMGRGEYEKIAPDIIGSMFYAKIAPWTPYPIRGVLWYQGCHNWADREFYVYQQRAIVSAWRRAWKNDRLPFYWVQLAAFSDPLDDPNQTGIGETCDWPALRDGQTFAADLPLTGEAIAIDIGDAASDHPANKFDVGNRLALLALEDVYGKDVEGRSPILRRMEIKDGKSYLTFDHVGSGLVVGKKTGREPMTPDPDGKLARFAIAGTDRRFVWANAEITGFDSVTVSSPEVAEPVAVRYAWQANPEGCNLYSREGLPAVPFRTDSWDK